MEQEKLNQEYQTILNVAAALCALVGAGLVFMALWLVRIGIVSDGGGRGFLASSIIILFSLIFFLPLWLRKKKWILLYNFLLGILLFVGYLVAAFRALLQAGTPGAQFALLALISCFGLWLFLIATNRRLRAWVQNGFRIADSKEGAESGLSEGPEALPNKSIEEE